MTDTLDTLYDAIADALVDKGYFYTQNALPGLPTTSLQQRIVQLETEDALKRAGIGRDSDHHINNDIRQDQIRWLQPNQAAEQDYLSWMEHLRVGINQRLFMGLFDYECHFAHYPEGAFYKQHLDAFKGRTNRVLTTVYYLNDGWEVTQGGELILYAEDGNRILETVFPETGTLLIFLSDRFPHEVLPTKRDRYSIAGWYRVNNSLNAQIDPAS
ncbi:MAG: 2OG-Fe(II) oxygenase [Nitrincola sp.]|nr:2OG-Fe(II) oxygenase [Nitrincola sp.]